MTPILSATILRTQSDGRLLALAGQGHERAFEAIVERYRRPMLRHCRRFLPEPRAEDAVQQTFLNAWSAIQRGAEVGDLRAWLYRIGRNAALDAAKRSGYDYSQLTEALELGSGTDSEIERRWVIRETLSGVAALPENQREALLRTVVEGQSRAEIARDLQVSEGAVRQLVHRARATLRAAATAVTPTPLVNWATAMGREEPDVAVRIAELVAGGGAAGGAVLLKTGTAVMAAGAIAVGAGSTLEKSPADRAVASPSSRAQGGDSGGGDDAPTRGVDTADDRARSLTRTPRPAGLPASHRRAGSDRGPGSLHSGPGAINGGSGSSGSGSDSSGPGSGGDDDSSGPGSGGDDDSSGSGSSGSGSGSSGSGSGSSGGGSGSSGSGDDDDGSGSEGDDDDSSGSGSGDDDGDDDDSSSSSSGGGGGGGGSGSSSGDDDDD